MNIFEECIACVSQGKETSNDKQEAKIETVYSSELKMNYPTAWLYSPEDRTPHSYYCDNLKSNIT
jgi:hypothetical protein